MWSNGRSEAALEAALPAAIEIRRIRSARRLRLRYDDGAGILKLTCPVRTSRKAALTWALDQREWIESQLRAALPPQPFESGGAIPILGEEVRLLWEASAPRTPALEDGVLKCGGPQSRFAARVERYLKTLALDVMSQDVANYAARAGVSVASVAVGDAVSRWGSCSSQGAIRLSWRLILAPPDVRRYVVAHEVAHRVHLNHGAAFKALEAQLFGPGVATAKAALRRLGPRLRRVGRGR